jgi:hypothetical protein
MFKKILTPREKTILYITIGVAIFGLLFNLLLAPVLSRNDSLNKEINLSRAKLKKYLRLLSQKELIRSKYDKFTTTFKVSQGGGDALVSAFTELENLAKNANIRIIDLRPQGGTKGANIYRENLIELRTEGTIEGYLRFIYNVENSLSLLRIKKFLLTAKPATENLEGTFSISSIAPSE